MRPFTIFLATLLCVALLNGCSKNEQQTESSQSNTPQAQADGEHIGNVSRVNSVQKNDGNKVADFSWVDETGNKISFADFAKDNVVLINFWATWCGPCRRELPDLVALNNEYRTKNIKVIGISVDQDGDVLKVVHDFAAQSNLNYPIVVDNGDLQKVFGGIDGIPTSFFVNKKGEIVRKMIGMQSKETFQQTLLSIAG
ncbi:MAG TPA: TlpA disulfide reductase family protein [Bacteroidota bacterium]|nr:TlpA disulfide reductase family protein [Bacteroidota bacterium]